MKWMILGGMSGLIMIIISFMNIMPGGNNPPTTDILPETIPQEETDLANQDTRIIFYDVEPIPNVSNRQVVQNALDDAVSSWEEENNLLFERTDAFPDVQIEWQTIAADSHAGLATYSEKYKGVITIGLGKFDCNNDYVQYDGNLLHQTILHEIGHILGLEHHPEETHLMYGVDYIDLRSIKNSEYVIPKHYDGFFEGYIQLETEYEILNSELEDLSEEIEKLEKKHAAMYTEYEIILSKIDTDNQYLGQVNLMEKELVRLDSQIDFVIDDHNEIVHNMNELVDKMGCYPDIEK